jgi:pimeloyl-ACP methyl ester carboxylesterase
MSRLVGHHCLAPDLPGHGRSSGLPWRSLAETADMVGQLIEARIPARRAHLVGLSVGGAIAHTLLANMPELLDHVIVDGAGALPSRRNAPYLLGIAAIAPFLHSRPVIAMLSRSVGKIPESDRADIRTASRRAFYRSYRDALAVRLTRAEVGAGCPTLFVAGERETDVRQSNAALAVLMPRAVARFVPGTGHGWLGVDLALHVDMVEAWLTGRHLPDDLVEETTPWPRAQVERLLNAARVSSRFGA